MSQIDWSKAPEGHDYHLAWIHGEGQFYRDGGDRFFRAGGSYARKSEIPSNVVITKRPTWTGEGLPPVGAKVTIDKGKLRIWEEAEMFVGPVVEVVSTFRLENSDMVVVYLDEENACCVFRASMCRMPKTPEQIAAEEREQEINEIASILTHNGTFFEDAERLYDAGCRMPGKGAKA